MRFRYRTTLRSRDRRRQVPNRPRKVVGARRTLVDEGVPRRDAVGIGDVGIASSRAARHGRAARVGTDAFQKGVHLAAHEIPHRNGTATVGLCDAEPRRNRHTTHQKGPARQQADGVADATGARRGSRRFRGMKTLRLRPRRRDAGRGRRRARRGAAACHRGRHRGR